MSRPVPCPRCGDECKREDSAYPCKRCGRVGHVVLVDDKGNRLVEWSR